MREIEIKLKVRDRAGLEKRLAEAGCVLSAPIFQHDMIYSKNSSKEEFESAKEGDVIPRIRRMDDRAEFNLKQQKSSEMDNLEYETEVKDPEAVHAILGVLGYMPVIEVKKMRCKGKFGEYEICLDEVEGLGNYVELEKLAADDADPAAIRADLFVVLERFGLSRKDEETKGYDTQLYQLSRKQ